MTGAPPAIVTPGDGARATRAGNRIENVVRSGCYRFRWLRDLCLSPAVTEAMAGILGLDVARDAATRQSMLRALTALAATPVQALRGRRLDAADFDRLFSDDPVRDVLVWLNDPEAVPWPRCSRPRMRRPWVRR